VNEERVVFFGTGEYAESVFEALYKKFAPVAYCDNELKKNVRHFFLGLPVLLIEQVEAKYPGCLYYLTVDAESKPLAIESLVGKGVDRTRIINFEVFNRYDSCPELEGHMCYSSIRGVPALSFCLPVFDADRSPCILIEGSEYDRATRTFFDTRDRIINSLNHADDGKAENPCLGCRKVKDGLWPADRRLRTLYIDNPQHNVIRSSGQFSEATRASGTDFEGALSFIRFLKAKGIIDSNTGIHLEADELLCHPLQDDILSVVLGNPCTIYTNASQFSEKIDEALTTERAKLYVSMDAGTRGTYAKVKRADIFDKVCENIRRYSLGGFVHLRYNILPGVNDNKADIDGFIGLCSRLKVKAVDISRDASDMVPFGEHTIDMFVRFAYELKNRAGGTINLLDETFSANPIDLLRVKEERSGLLRKVQRDVAAICCSEARQGKVVVFTYAYNAEKTLPRTIESVLSQTFDDFTYYIVDNGSQDATGDIIRDYADRDKRIVALANAQNSYWKYANRFQNLIKGHGADSYFCMLDADDEYKPDFLKQTLTFAKKYNLDIVVAGSDYIDAKSGHLLEQKKCSKDLILEGTDFADEFVNYRKNINALWNKLYKSAIILQLGAPYIGTTFAEDSVIVLICMTLSKRVGFLSESLHKYYVYSDSRSRAFNIDRLNDCHTLFRYYINYLERFQPISPLNMDYLYAIWLGWMDDFIFKPLCASDLPATKKLYHVSKMFESNITNAMLRRENPDPRFSNLARRDAFLQSVRQWICAQGEPTTAFGKSLVQGTLENMDVSSKESV